MFYFLAQIFPLLIYLFIAVIVGLFCVFALNGGAAGSAGMNEVSTIFLVIYIVILVPVFLFAIKRIFSKEKGTPEIILASTNGINSTESVNLTNVNIIYLLQAVSIVFTLTMIIAVIMNYLKINTVKGTWLETHFKWQIRTNTFAKQIGSVYLK